MRARPRLFTKTKKTQFSALRSDALNRIIRLGSHTADYQSREDSRAAEDSGDTDSDDDPPPTSSIDWLLDGQNSDSNSQGNTHEYIFTQTEPAESQDHDFGYEVVHGAPPEMTGVAGGEQLSEDPGEIIQRMREAMVTINYRKAVPIAHFFPDEEPLKKELKQGPTLFEVTRIDQAILDLDAFL